MLDNKARETEMYLDALASAVDHSIRGNLGQQFGFTVLIFEFGKPGTGCYVSNALRKDMITALRETADRIEKNQTIGRTKGTA